MKKFLVALLVAMLALSCVAMAETFPAEDWQTHMNKYHNGGGLYDWTYTDDYFEAKSDAAAYGWDWPALITDPDCDTAGKCYHKGESVEQIFYIKALGHDWDDGKMTSGDCNEQITTTYSCQRVYNGVKCDGTKTETTTGTHAYGIVEVQAKNCYDHRTWYYGCTVCGEIKPTADGKFEVYTWWENGKEGDPKKGFKVDGKVTYVFKKDCAPYDLDTLTEEQKANKAYHKLLSPWVETEEQTCVDPKVEYRACPYCGYEQTKITEPYGHSFAPVAGSVCATKHTHKNTIVTLSVNASNCKTVALYLDVKYCEHEGCDAVQTQPIPSASGVWGAQERAPYNKDVRDALNAIDGRYPKDLAKIYCIYVDGAPQKGHHIADESKTVYEVVEASTCIPGDEGEFTQITYCSVCKGIIPELTTDNAGGTMSSVLPLAKHTWGEWEHLFDASEDTDFVSYWRRQCSVCLIHETSVEGPCGKYNHTAAAPVKENVVKATYTAAGSYEEVVYCSVCKIELSREEKVEAMLEGLNPADGKIWDDGKAIEGTGMVEFNGGKFYVVDGVLQNAMGVTNVGDKFLFLAHGQLQDVTQLAEYDGEWFYVVDGEVQVGFNGLVEYDGAKFLVGAGRVQFEQTTLFNDGTQWVLISAGQVATSYTGAFTYDGVVFQVVNGIVK